MLPHPIIDLGRAFCHRTTGHGFSTELHLWQRWILHLIKYIAVPLASSIGETK